METKEKPQSRYRRFVNFAKKKLGIKESTSVKDILINLLILMNLVSAIMMTMPKVMAKWEQPLDWFCNISVVIFMAEMIYKLHSTKEKTGSVLPFFRKKNDEEWGKWESWNIFDFTITVLSFLSMILLTTDIIGVRSARMLKVLNGMKFLEKEKMKDITESLFKSIPSIMGTLIYFLMLYLIYALIGINLYSETNPEYFGDIGTSFYTLFQIMTLNWTDVKDALYVNHNFSWFFLFSFIFLASYILLNVIVGIVIDNIQEIRKKRFREQREARQKQMADIENQLTEIKEMLRKYR